MILEQIMSHVLIDCPPSLSLLTIMALVSSESLLVPLANRIFCIGGCNATYENNRENKK